MAPARYSVTEDDQVAFSLTHFRRHFARFAAIMAGLIGVLAIIFWQFDDGGSAIAVLAGGLIGLLIVWLICRFITVPRFARKAWGEFALIKEQVELTLRSDGFSMVQPSASVDNQWSQMAAWNESPAVFAIYVTRHQAYILPKDQIGSEVIDYARARLIASGLIKPGGVRK